MITNKIMEYLEGEGVPLDPEQLEVAVDACRQTFARNLGLRRDDGSRKIRMPRPSGTWACGRQIVYNALALETEGYGWRSRLAFTLGDLVEAMGILLCRRTFKGTDLIITPEENGEQLHLEAEIDPVLWDVPGAPFRVQGNVDMTIRGLTGEEEPVDWKSIARFGFKDAQDAASDPSHPWWMKERGGYIAQVRWYQMLLRATGRSPAQRGYLAFVCKDTGHMTEIVIDRDAEAERELIRRHVYVNEQIEHAQERRAILLEGAGIEDEQLETLDRFGEREWKRGGNPQTDHELSTWVNERVPRASFTKGAVVARSANTKRPDGTKGPCLELNTGRDADPQMFRCSYCDHTQRCWPGFYPVALSKPVYRTNVMTCQLETPPPS